MDHSKVERLVKDLCKRSPGAQLTRSSRSDDGAVGLRGISARSSDAPAGPKRSTTEVEHEKKTPLEQRTEQKLAISTGV